LPPNGPDFLLPTIEMKMSARLAEFARFVNMWSFDPFVRFFCLNTYLCTFVVPLFFMGGSMNTRL
jgi:hypothetical protein